MLKIISFIGVILIILIGGMMINGVVDTLKQSEMDSVKETGELIETGSNANDALTLYTIVAAILIGGTGYGLFIKK